MQGLDVENSTVAIRSPNGIAVPEWLEQKLLDDMRSAYAWSAAQAAAGRGLKEIEHGLRERVMGLGAKLLQASLARGYGNGYTAGSIPCAGCPGRMRYVADRDKVITSWFQEIRLRRAYYHCRRCKTGVFPLDEQLDVVGTSLSPTIREAICLVDAEVSFEIKPRSRRPGKRRLPNRVRLVRHPSGSTFHLTGRISRFVDRKIGAK
jgi:hypothetical protein